MELQTRCLGCLILFPVNKLSTCSGCRAAKYCSKSCQKSNWKEHRNRCHQHLISGEFQEICAVCQKVSPLGKKFSWCSLCQSIKYCSANCQKLDWPTHKIHCQPPSGDHLGRAQLAIIKAFLERCGKFLTGFCHYHTRVTDQQRGTMVHCTLTKNDEEYIALLMVQDWEVDKTQKDKLVIQVDYPPAGKVFKSRFYYPIEDGEELSPMIQKDDILAFSWISCSINGDDPAVHVLSFNHPDDKEKIEYLNDQIGEED